MMETRLETHPVAPTAPQTLYIPRTVPLCSTEHMLEASPTPPHTHYFYQSPCFLFQREKVSGNDIFNSSIFFLFFSPYVVIPFLPPASPPGHEYLHIPSGSCCPLSSLPPPMCRILHQCSFRPFSPLPLTQGIELQRETLCITHVSFK